MTNKEFTVEALIEGLAFTVHSNGTEEGTIFEGEPEYAEAIQDVIQSNERIPLGPHGGAVKSGYHEDGIIAAILSLEDRYPISIIEMPFSARRYFSTCTYPGLPK